MCYNIHEVINVICKVCGVEFTPMMESHVYCSTQCQKKDANARRTEKRRQAKQHLLKELICPNCGKEFRQQRLDNVYCSEICKKTYRQKLHIEERSKKRLEAWEQLNHTKNCAVCGKEFELDKHYRHREYCSGVCKRKANRFIASNNSRFGGNRYIVLERDNYECKLCGAISQLSLHHRDCSGKSENPNHDVDNLISLCKSCHATVHEKLKKGIDILIQF